MSFEAFDIKHLSASSLNKWTWDRGAWVAHYVMGLRDEMGPAVWRGSAVEAGLECALRRPQDDALAHAMMQFENDAQGDADDPVDKERENIAPMLDQAKTAFANLGYGDLIATQTRVECWLDGVDIPLIGYADFVFDGLCCDLKTTLRCPSEASGPKPDHKLQFALYAHARKEDRAAGVYVTPKKYQPFELGPDDIRAAIKDLTRKARALQATLRAAAGTAAVSGRSPADVLAEMCAPDFSHFVWSDEQFQQTAVEAVRAWQ